jgi:hypothetical protein
MGTQNKQTQLPVFVVEAEHVDVPIFGLSATRNINNIILTRSNFLQ